MELKEFDNLLHDVEVKLKRLRALYEQWFQGIERTEPLVARKDLDRTLLILNKEKPRNTAARFRLAQLVASYGLYQTYWQRISRQIEEGTFERHLHKVRKRGAGTNRKAKVEEIELDIDTSDTEDEIASVMRELEERPVQERTAPARPVLTAFSPFAKKAAPAPIAKSEAPKAQAEPEKAKPKATFAKPKASAPPAKPIEPQAKHEPLRLSDIPPPLTISSDPPAPTHKPISSVSVAPTKMIGTAAKKPLMPPRVPKPPGIPAAPPPPPPPKPAAARPPPPPPPRPLPPPAKPQPQASLPKPAPRDDGDQSMRKLYDQYVDARRKNNETVENLKFEQVAESVKKMVPKLREKHGDKKIEFEVVVQNGRVGFRPKVE